MNVISNCTECPLPTLGPYTASKAALLALSDAMRPELARTGVKVILELDHSCSLNTRNSSLLAGTWTWA